MILFYFIFLRQEAIKANANELSNKRKTRPLRGEAGPLGRVTPPRKSNQSKTPTKDNPQTTKLNIQPHLRTYSSPPIPFNVKVVPPTKDIPSTPRMVKTFKHGRGRKVTDLNLLEHPFPCRPCVHK